MPTVYREVIDELGARIVGGGLEPGTTITLDWVGRRFDISRTIAREVVQVLASMGLVQSRRRTGITVLEPGRWDAFDPAVIRWRLDGDGRRLHLVELSQLRAAVEPAAAALAAVLAEEAVRTELLELARRMEQTGAAGDLAAFLDLDIRFHRLLLDSSRNSLFAGLGDVVEEVLRGRTDHDLMPPHPKPEARRLHAQVADAVERGDGEAARLAMSTICLEVVAEMSGPA